ncbi:TetR/AcrR family transcriptional regulator [Actinophytocola sp.]|uniref:TetR/AcrR family transcriptional regulator n=1 Tax=Actinophytocola sp. TaxID=1872138 RepID=UPI0025BCEDC3|nr:helix-turn-helix domain-containing protein [Actinophytocola sp.]
MRQIAAAAGVAERTVYTVFPTKTALFHEVMNIAAAGDELPIPVAERTEFTSTQTELDPHRAVRNLVDHGSALLERAGDLSTAAIASSGAEPDMREFAAREFAARASAETAKNLHDVARAWKRNGLLRDDLTAKEAGAILYALNSPQVHHIFRRDQDWDVDRYRDWLASTITTTTMLRSP